MKQSWLLRCRHVIEFHLEPQRVQNSPPWQYSSCVVGISFRLTIMNNDILTYTNVDHVNTVVPVHALTSPKPTNQSPAFNSTCRNMTRQWNERLRWPRWRSRHAKKRLQETSGHTEHSGGQLPVSLSISASDNGLGPQTKPLHIFLGSAPR